jgi:predicted phosphodiesterase
MYYAVLSDVHANLEALEAVLKDVDKRKIENILFLGDAVGYGPDPNECLELLERRCKILIAGNHDWGVTGLTDINYFNEYARHALEWTMGVITDAHSKLLRSLPAWKESKDDDMILVHSTPWEPEKWHYLLTLRDAEMNFDYFDNKFCFLGHSHQPFIIEKVSSGELIEYTETARIKKSSRYIINAGSVGQPRDGDARASYIVIGNSKLEIVRIPYNIEAVQEKMRKGHLPYLLIERLSIGR